MASSGGFRQLAFVRTIQRFTTIKAVFQPFSRLIRLFRMFYIGNFADMDTDETIIGAEQPDIVLGIYDNLVLTELIEVDADDDAIISNDEHPSDDYLYYYTAKGETKAQLDSASLYKAKVLLGDGSTLSVPVLVIQATNGDVFISEHPDEPIDGLKIQSIELVSLDTSQSKGINAGASDVRNATVVCYASGTMIDTPDGPRHEIACLQWR